jgi:hypothetical protein
MSFTSVKFPLGFFHSPALLYHYFEPLPCPRESFFSVLSVAKKRLITEAAETLRVLCVKG